MEKKKSMLGERTRESQERARGKLTVILHFYAHSKISTSFIENQQLFLLLYAFDL